MTPQEIFDTVVKHLEAQGGRSTDHLGCLYRGPKGKKCAVGSLISDDDYCPAMERMNVGRLLPKFSHLPDWMRQNVELLTELQTVHDDGANWGIPEATAVRRKKLFHIAREHGLNPVVLNA